MTDTVTPDLTDTERAMLDLESGWWKHPGAKDTAIREHLDLSPTVYYARLNRLIDQPAAIAGYPLVVRRLQRLREARRTHRNTRARVGQNVGQ